MSKTGLITDRRMLDHKSVRKHPECPQRLSAILQMLQKNEYFNHPKVDYVSEVTRIATAQQLSLVYSKKYIEHIQTLWPGLSHRKDLTVLDSYFNQHTQAASKLSAGCSLLAVDGVMQGRWKNSFALIRPPGHHSGFRNTINGFCVFNNAAIAARYAQERYGMAKIAILDYDVHHGDGTQRIFQKDPNILFISMHRFDRGTFYPVGQYGSYINCGKKGAEGSKLNIPLNYVDNQYKKYPFQAPGDNQYIYLYSRIVEPVLAQFQPQMIIVSSGFDASRYDPLGGFTVTPNGYYFLTKRLMELGKPLVCLLEGGYNIQTTAQAVCGVVKALVGQEHLPEKQSIQYQHLKESCFLHNQYHEQADQIIQHHSKYWKSLYSQELVKYTRLVKENNKKVFGIVPDQNFQKNKKSQKQLKKLQDKEQDLAIDKKEEQILTQAGQQSTHQFYFASGHIQKFRNFSINNDRLQKMALRQETLFYQSRFPQGQFAPRYYGTSQNYIILQNMLFGQKSHTVMDIKLSRQSRNPHISKEKKQKQVRKERMSTTQKLGFRVVGITTNNFKERGLLISSQDIVRKLLGKVVTKQNKKIFIDFLGEMMDVLKQVKRSYYGTSLILIKGDSKSSIAWIDFHYWYDNCQTYDQSLVEGLQNLSRFIQQTPQEQQQYKS